MLSRCRTFVLCGLVLSTLGFAKSAQAAETALRCSPEQTRCETADITFSKTKALPIQGGFDTGWVPANSPLQVHLFAQLYAETAVDLGGRLETTWPEALTLATPGTPGAGALGIHYGVDIGAEAMVSIDVLGQTFNWSGDIPFVPQFDFQVDADTTFDPWAFDGVSVSGTTLSQTLAEVDVTSFIGVDIPGLSGGFRLDTYIELTATYRTTQIDLLHTPGSAAVSGGPIVAETDTSLAGYAGGPSADFIVQPVGEVLYEGTLHLVPTFYIETVGPDFSIPIADIPIPFEFEDKDFVFDPVTVHVPLPDIAVVELHGEDNPTQPLIIDLGTVPLGETRSEPLPVRNDGEENLTGEATSEDAAFVVEGANFSIDAGAATADLAVSFTAVTAGAFETTITLASNDPDEPTRTIEVRALVEDPDGGGGSGGGGENGLDDEDDGCDCRSASSQSGAPGLLGLTLAFGLVLARRRRR